ncbi:unnamed protein product [Urochloa humidicola]
MTRSLLQQEQAAALWPPGGPHCEASPSTPPSSAASRCKEGEQEGASRSTRGLDPSFPPLNLMFALSSISPSLDD